MDQAKCIGYNNAHELNVWSNGENAELDPAKSYDVYWDGNGEHAASFDEIA